MPDLNDPKHWQKCADEARVMATHLTNPTAQQHILNCVAGYERLVRMTQERLAGIPKRPDVALLA